MRFLEGMTAAILASHRIVPPYGMAGGDPGQGGKTWVERADGSHLDLGPCDTAELEPDDIIVIQTPTGGAFGPKEERKASDDQ
jgi:5-oxoprolinase (ATP-hydrolysing)